MNISRTDLIEALFHVMEIKIGSCSEEEAKAVFMRSGLWMFGKGSRSEFEAKVRGEKA